MERFKEETRQNSSALQTSVTDSVKTAFANLKTTVQESVQEATAGIGEGIPTPMGRRRALPEEPGASSAGGKGTAAAAPR